ncbi:fatty acid synthase-like [Polistes fuscatus]|uniref:fatty acid synthase-like n=1 Tax=Polistes fuscatus TaxID=30207 RepID=UPI001CA8D29A|nr:fatty acid synthase-like [Polistes fuscatus]
MIEQGARKFIIVSNMSNRGSENLVLKWREYGATIIVRQEVDLSKATSFDKIFKEALTIAQLDGIFDLQRMKIDSSISSLKYFKVTEILNKYSRKHCPSHVKFFIFSSLNLDEDSLGDTNVEKLCKKRKESSLHGLFILLPNFVRNTLTETKFQNLCNTKMSWFLKRLNAILCADSSVIAVRQILTDNSPNDDKKNIFVGETDDEQRIDEGNPQDEEIRQFEQYLYNYD